MPYHPAPISPTLSFLSVIIEGKDNEAASETVPNDALFTNSLLLIAVLYKNETENIY
jgi:hypothetical protein